MAELVDWLHHESITRAGTNSGTSYIPTLKTAKCPLCGKETDVFIYYDGVFKGCRYCVKPHINNADKLRSMSDEELAEFITARHYTPHCPVPQCEADETTDCEQCWLAWLRKEAEDG